MQSQEMWYCVIGAATSYWWELLRDCIGLERSWKDHSHLLCLVESCIVLRGNVLSAVGGLFWVKMDKKWTNFALKLENQLWIWVMGLWKWSRNQSAIIALEESWFIMTEKKQTIWLNWKTVLHDFLNSSNIVYHKYAPMGQMLCGCAKKCGRKD